MSLIPPDLSSKLQDLSRLLRQSGDSAAQVNRLREQLVASGPNAPVAQRLDALYSRSIQLSWEEQNLASACVHNLESLLRSVNTTGKRGATGESGRAESGRAASLADGGAASAKAKRARVAESDVKIVRPPSPSSAEYPQSTDRDLEQLTGAAAEEPLCGAVALPVDAPLPVGARVVSRLSGPKVTPQHWAVGIVVRHIAAKAKYILKDEESSGSLKQHTITSKYVVPLPTSLPAPSAQSVRNVFQKGASVLAMYPASRRFVKGVVVASPGDHGGRRSYVVAFEAGELEEGAVTTMAVVPACIVGLPASLLGAAGS